MTSWRLAQRTAAMDPGIIQEVLRLAEDPEVISLAGGLPAAQTFPVEVMSRASERVFANDGRASLQYSSAEGYLPLREWVANDLKKQGIHVKADQVLMLTGSQQALDLVGKVFIDRNSRILVESPTYMGALQAFVPMEPVADSVEGDDFGPSPDALREKVGQGDQKARFIYMIPNFQNPTGRFMPADRRQALAAVAKEHGLPVLEDNPYGELWFDDAPPAAISSYLPEQSIYISSFSKILSPGLRLGYMVVPENILDEVLYVKMSSDLHTPSLTQRIAYETIKDGFLDEHIPSIRQFYKEKRDLMLAALEREMQGLDAHWTRPAGGMFLWLKLPESIDTLAMLPKATARRMAYVPGEAFYADGSKKNYLRLSYVTATPEQIDQAIAALAQTIRAELG